jgi:hypothetical protein
MTIPGGRDQADFYNKMHPVVGSTLAQGLALRGAAPTGSWLLRTRLHCVAENCGLGLGSLLWSCQGSGGMLLSCANGLLAEAQPDLHPS